MSVLPSGTVTFLMTDVQGSTRLWESDPVAMNQAMLDHDIIAADAVAAHAGSILKARGEGDSLFCVFTRVSDAIATSCEIHERFARHPWPIPKPVQV